MSTFNYSKKRLAPLVQKYAIDVNKDLTFKALMQMFDSQTDYQIWSLKVVKGGFATLEEVKFISDWAKNNSTEIKRLKRQNIISYGKSKQDIELLLVEIKGLDMLQVLNNAINKFNTNQRHMIRETLGLSTMDGVTAATTDEIAEWFGLMKAFNKLPRHRQDKLIVTSSSFNDDFNALKEHISTVFANSYVWDREDLLRFMQLQARDCKVVFDANNVLMLEVPSFESSKSLCGSGRTSWCLTKGENFFNDYVLNKQSTQYFIFDFNKRESDELSHVGFTVNSKEGITNAHSTTNQTLMHPFTYRDKEVDIHSVLKSLQISHKIYCPLHDLKLFNWDAKSIKNVLDNYPNLELVLDKDDKLVYKVGSIDVLNDILRHTRINFSRLPRIYRGHKCYLIFNLNVEYTCEDALSFCLYREDDYGMETFNSAWNPYGVENHDGNYVKNVFNMLEKDFLDCASLPIELMLHRCLDRMEESEAIELITSNKELDVNFSHHYSIPVFKIIECGLVKAFQAIINHPNLNWGECDATGDTILSHLMYGYMYEENEQTNQLHQTMIEALLELNIDFNMTDAIGDTMLTLAMESKKANWLALDLIQRPDVNVNVVNENNWTALTKAISYRNTPVIKALLSRPDTVVRNEDFEMAEQVGLDLNKMVKRKPATVAALEAAMAL